MSIRNENLDKDVLETALAICTASNVDVRIESVLRALNGRHAVMTGTCDGRPAILRLALSDKARANNEETWVEIARVGPHMADGQHRIAQGLKNIDDGRLIVTELAAGEPFLPQLKNGDPKDAKKLAEWLHKYTAPVIEIRKAGVDFWLKQARNSSQKQPFPHLKAKEDQILTVMKALAAEIRGKSWRVAITHGDYHPNNLLWDGKTLTGIDIGGSAYLPIYKDMARCLIHLARRNIGFNDSATFGVDQSLTEAFTASFKLQTDEVRWFLPFFLGFECLIKIERSDAPAWRVKVAEKLYDNFLKDADTLS